MKKILFAAMAAMVLFASCAKEDNNGADNDAKYLSIKIAGVIPSKALEAPGLTAVGTITLNSGHIFIVNPLGVVTYSEALNVSQATGAGQILGQDVAADSRVYVIGNIPAGDVGAITALTDIASIQAAVSAMTTQSDYKTAALANSNGQPAAIVPAAGNTATATVSIKPLISRLELTQVKGAGDITAFTVAGVYVDSYYPSFTYGGSYSGTIFSQGQSTTFTGIGDVGPWAAAGTPKVAAPTSGNVWAHNVASGALPRFIIALEGVKYNPGLSVGSPAGEIDLTGTTLREIFPFLTVLCPYMYHRL